MDEFSVNDGGGLYDNDGIIDSLIVDCNEIPKALMNGQNVRFCRLIYEMAVKLRELKQGIKNELDSRDKRIGELQEQLIGGGADGVGDQ